MRLAEQENIPDERLLAGAGRGDEAAFRQLYERHRDAVYRFAYRLTGATATAEDITHDCFMSLLQRPAAFDARRAALRTYLLAAARNLAFKHFRQHAPETVWDEASEPLTHNVDYTSPLRQVLAAELAGEVRRAILDLPPLQREALLLFEYEDLSLNEIATVTGADSGTIKARLYRARQNLQRALAPYWYGAPAHAGQEVRP